MTYRPFFALTWVIFLLQLSTFAYSQVRVLSSFRVQMEGDTTSYEVELPGVLQYDLIKNRVIPDPFVEMNEDSVQWVSDKNWLYWTVFSIDSAELKSAKDYRLHLTGVDTFSEVYLNGSLIGQTDDLFRSYVFSVSDYLLPGENRLVLRMLSPTMKAHAQYMSSGFNYPADNDRFSIHYSPYIRKSPYHFGWDWGPRILSYGVEEPIRLERITGPTLEECYVRSTLENGAATVAVVSETKHLAEEKATLTLAITNPEGLLVEKKQVPASGRDTLTFTIDHPLLWWPNGSGEQYLYQLTRTVAQEGGYQVCDTLRFGIREIQLLQESDKIGESFTFVVNGKPLYIKGANYLPHDRRFGGGDRTLEQLFSEDIVPAHFNMLRVWGGGTFETEEFYQLADQYGILIWQDFPFACSTYPNDPAFREQVSLEARDQLSRIRNHPSIALFCGNNEVLEGLKYWGWKNKYGYTDSQWKKMHEDYDSFFREHLKSLVNTYAPHIDYIHGSPVSSNWGRPKSLLSGDSHYWGVWFGSEDFTTFDTHYGRFASEFGFQAFPEMKTIHSFAPNTHIDSLNIEHPILEHRQRSFIGNERITTYMSRQYPVPKDFHDYVYVGQILQGNGMGYALRAIRRGYPENMGSLYWQLNDVWPTVSWSSIDYWGNYKAMHYKVREAYSPTIVDIIRKDNEYQLWLVSDSTSLDGCLNIQLSAHDYYGNKLWDDTIRYSVSSSPFSKRVKTLDPMLFETEQIYVQILVRDGQNTVVASQVFYPIDPKEMRLPTAQIEYDIYVRDGELTLELSSPVLVKDLFIETPEWQGARYSNNFLDILPGQTYEITISHSAITEGTTQDKLRFTCLNDILPL